MADGGTLSPEEFDFLWESFGAGEAPYPLELRSHGATMGERAVLRQQTLRQLAERRFLDTDGRPVPLLAHHLDLLGSVTVSVDSVHLPEKGASAVRALAGSADGAGLLAVQDGPELRLRSIEPDGLVSAVIALLPETPRGTEKSMTMPVVDGPQGRHAVPGSDRDRETYAELVGQERLRGGQIAANVKDEDGVRTRSAVLSWFDTASGRYLTRSSTGADGREWITIAPTDVATLRQRVAELVSDVGGRVGSVAP